MSRNRSLRRSLIGRLVAALAAIGVIGVIAAYSFGKRYAYLAYDRALFDSVATLADEVELHGDKLTVNLPPEAKKWLLTDEGARVIYRITDITTETVIASNGDLGPREEQSTIAGQPNYRDTVVDGMPFRVAYTRHIVDPKDLPVLVEIGESLGTRQRMTHEILIASLLLFGAMIGSAVLLVWRGVGSALEPLGVLEHEAGLRSGANLTPLDPEVAPLEVRALIHAINRLMASVGASIEAQKRFIANAAHQLRTPIAGLRLQAQLAQKQDMPASVRASLVEIEQSAGREAHLVEQLLTLSRAEAAEFAVHGEPVDLVQVAREIVGRYLKQADAKHIDLGYEGRPGDARIAANPVLIAELLANLVDNAVRCVQPGGWVTISAQREGDAVVLAVADNGPGFPADDAHHLFQRFHRRDTSPGGNGLGLAIVKEIAERHGGTVSVDSAAGRGTRISVRFPNRA